MCELEGEKGRRGRNAREREMVKEGDDHVNGVTLLEHHERTNSPGAKGLP